jgi:MoaA/NifB/PqqE/SkfB family radical SAM enzyme
VNFATCCSSPSSRPGTTRCGRELRSGRVEGSCSKCSATQGSHGGCRSTAYAFHGRFSAPDPFDLELNHGVDLTSLPR